MNRFISTLLFLILVLMAHGQVETYQDSVIYEFSGEDALFMRNQDIKRLRKWGSKIGNEFKIGKAFSIEWEFSPRLLDDRVNSEESFGLGLGSRYYYNMARRIREGKQANNLSGEYVGLMIGAGFGIYNIESDTTNRAIAKGFSFSIGKQERFFKNNYFDFSLNLDYNEVDVDLKFDTDVRYSSITLRTESGYGILLGIKDEIDESKLCSVIKCHKSRKSGFKINRNNLFALTRSQNNKNSEVKWNLQISPAIGYELKIAESSFSFNQKLSTEFTFSNFDNTGLKNFDMDNFGYAYDIGGRYYYNMTERVLTGEQGNNLTGDYVQFYFRHEDDLDVKAKGFLMIGGGLQKEVTNHLYFDLDLGLGPQLYGDKVNLVFNLIELDLNFAVGYMF